MVNRTQLLVLGFFGFAWIGLVILLLIDPAIYYDAMKLPAGRHPQRTWGFWVLSRPSSPCSPTGY